MCSPIRFSSKSSQKRATKHNGSTRTRLRQIAVPSHATTVGIEAKCQKLTTAFIKYLSIANPYNGNFFLFEVLFQNQFSPRVLAVIYFSFNHYESITGFEYSQMLEFSRISNCKTLVCESCTKYEHREVAAFGDKLHFWDREGGHFLHLEFSKVHSCCQAVPSSTLLRYEFCYLLA